MNIIPNPSSLKIDSELHFQAKYEFERKHYDEKSSQLTTNTSFKESAASDNAKNKFDLENMFGKISVIDELIISYLSTTYDHRQYDLDDLFDNAKSFLAIGIWTKRKDLILVSQSILHKITKFYLSKNQHNLQVNHHIVKLLRIDQVSINRMLKSYKVVLNAVRYDGWLIQFATSKLRKKADVSLAAIKQFPDVAHDCLLERKSDKRWSNRNWVLQVLSRHGCCLKYAKKFFQDKEIVCQAVASSYKGSALDQIYEYIPLEDDRDVTLNTILAGYNFDSIHPELQKDREMILAAIRSRQTEKVALIVKNDFPNDNELILAILGADGDYLNLFNYKNDDLEFVLTAVNQKGRSLKYASEFMRNNKKVVLTAVRNDGDALEFASNELRSDWEVVYTAVKSKGFAIKFIKGPLRSNREIVIQAFINTGDFSYIKDSDLKREIAADQRIMLQAIQTRAFAYEYLNTVLLNDKEILCATIQKIDFYNFNYFPEKLQETINSQKELLPNLISINYNTLNLVSFGLRDDFEFMKDAVQVDARSLIYASKRLQVHPKILSNARFQGVPIFSAKDIAKIVATSIQNQEQEQKMHNSLDYESSDLMSSDNSTCAVM